MTSVTGLFKDRGRLRLGRRPKPAVQPAAPRPQRRDCQGQLIAALSALSGGDVTIEQASMRPWCSATFVGAQHRLLLRVSGPDAMTRAQALADGMRDAEFKLHGHIVAEVAVDDMHADDHGGAALSLAVLTIEDW